MAKRDVPGKPVAKKAAGTKAVASATGRGRSNTAKKAGAPRTRASSPGGFVDPPGEQPDPWASVAFGTGGRGFAYKRGQLIIPPASRPALQSLIRSQISGPLQNKPSSQEVSSAW